MVNAEKEVFAKSFRYLASSTDIDVLVIDDRLFSLSGNRGHGEWDKLLFSGVGTRFVWRPQTSFLIGTGSEIEEDAYHNTTYGFLSSYFTLIIHLI